MNEIFSQAYSKNISSESRDTSESYENFVQDLLKVVNHHAPLKSKSVRGNYVSFMNKYWKKVIYERTRVKNI